MIWGLMKRFKITDSSQQSFGRVSKRPVRPDATFDLSFWSGKGFESWMTQIDKVIN